MPQQTKQIQRQSAQPPKPKLTYPVNDPSMFGPHYWHVLHNTAANFPESPSRYDKMQYGMFMRFLLNHLPCEDPCRTNALEWIKQHPFNLSGREYFFRDTVDFHNHVNEVTGKQEQVNYKDIFKVSKECKNCNLHATPPSSQSQSQPQPQITAPVAVAHEDPPSSVPPDAVSMSPPLEEPTPEEASKGSNTQQKQAVETTNVRGQGDSIKESIDLYKRTINEMAEKMAADKGQPAPEIEFDACPDGSDTSCITADGKIFLNPSNFSLETFFHEMDHYFDLKEGKTVDDSAGTNSSATKFAREAISKGFDLESQQPQQSQQLETGESTVASAPTATVLSHAKKKRSRRRRRSRDREEPPQQQQQPQPQQVRVQQAEVAANPYRQVVTDVYGSGPYQPPQVATGPGFDQMPQFRAALQEIQRQETEEKLDRYENSGVLSFLDPIYEYPASVLGVDKEDLNLIQTPVILSNVSKTIMDAYLTPIASIAFSFLFGAVLMVAGVFLHEKIPPRDILFMELLGSLFFWDMIRTLNPKKLYLLKKEVERIQTQRTGGDDPFGQPQPLSIKREIFETPGSFQERDEARDAPKALSEEELVAAGKFWMEQNQPGRKFGVLKGMPHGPGNETGYVPEYGGSQSPYQMAPRYGGQINLRPYSIRDRYL